MSFGCITLGRSVSVRPLRYRFYCLRMGWGCCVLGVGVIRWSFWYGPPLCQFKSALLPWRKVGWSRSALMHLVKCRCLSGWGLQCSTGRCNGVVKYGTMNAWKAAWRKVERGHMSGMWMREDYLKRFRIDACLDDVQAKTENIKVVGEGEALKVSAA